VHDPGMSSRWCPTCGAEYREGFSTCSDCGVALVDTPLAPLPNSPPFGARRPRSLLAGRRHGRAPAAVRGWPAATACASRCDGPISVAAALTNEPDW